MARAEKIIEKWVGGHIKGQEKYSDVVKVLVFLKFNERRFNFKGQHLRIHDPRLKEWSNSKDDSLTIPTESKSTVLGFYIKQRIVPLISYLNDLEQRGTK